MTVLRNSRVGVQLVGGALLLSNIHDCGQADYAPIMPELADIYT